jgi:peptidoglycan/LPS O-acetylase OafA/YrhL
MGGNQTSERGTAGARASGGRHRRHVHGTQQVGGSAWVGARGRFRVGVEGLRAVAILAMVLYHAGPGAAGGGYVGVDIFYVLSGFPITGLLWAELGRTGRPSFALLYARRARRLLPAAMLMVATMVALLAALPAAVVLSPLVGLAGLVLILAAVIVVETTRYAQIRRNLRGT